MVKEGVFITFEGIDGSGKSTQARKLKETFGNNAYLFRDPGSDTASEDIRKLIFEHKEKLSYLSEIMLFCSARNILYNNHIKPKLNEGKIVICDRYLDSTTVYQGETVSENSQQLELLHTINNISTEGRKPDLTFLINTNPKIARERIVNRKHKNIYDEMPLHYYETLQRRYLEIAKTESRFRVINGDHSIEDQHECIILDLFPMVALFSNSGYFIF